MRWLLAATLGGSIVFSPAPAGAQTPAPQTATGIVFHDKNWNGRRDSGEEGLSNVRVSNQRDIVKTDKDGRYRLPVDDDTILFVIKPKGYATPLDENNLPKFYYIHKPNGSPKQKFPGVPPTGPLPASVDFPLRPQREPNKFRAIFFGDPQPRNEEEVNYVIHDVVEELIGTDASFGVTLGDIAFDNLNTFASQNRGIALIGIPWYNVLGNHDINFDSPDDKHSDETFERTFGPSYYSFDHGTVHFIVLDDVHWKGVDEKGAGRGYGAGLGADQVEFIRRDLALTPKDQLVVLMMHIPITEVTEKQEVFDMLSKRPFTLSVSGHTHFQEHRFITREGGWTGPEPHHHVVNVTVCGDWWNGAKDEVGIPHATMRDGAPNGYSIFTFDGKKYSIAYKAARRPADYQMNIFAPEEIASADAEKTEVLVNVFAGSEKSTVEMRLGDDGAWAPLVQVRQEDPYFLAMKAAEESPRPPDGRKLNNAMKSPHLWRGTLPANPKPGTHAINVRTRDMFGQVYTDTRAIRVQ